MHSLRVATGMTGLAIVTTVLLLAQFLSEGPAPFVGVTAVPSVGAVGSATAAGTIVRADAKRA